VEWAIRQLRELLIGALRQGPIPQHVAFVMDGNRRFARSHHIETVEGHNLGFEALARVRRSPLDIRPWATPSLDSEDILTAGGC
jgi:undecaprenyl pyrophosphate synthase